MKILLCSIPFRPSIGGIESVSRILADHFRRAGHEVIVVTRTAGDDVEESAPCSIVRRPSAKRLLALVVWSDVVVHNNISLRFAWPLLVARRPWVIAHHTWIEGATLAGWLKRAVLRHAHNIAVSRALARSLPVDASIVANPYAEDVFGPETRTRDRELIVVSRLVSDKGLHLALEAVALLSKQGRCVLLTIVGDGPESGALHQLAKDLAIDDQVQFEGRRDAPEVASLLNRHRVLVVPSLWEEPFGVVVLEAIACGCVPLVFRRGGLPEAVGAAGAIADGFDASALARGIRSLLDDSTAVAQFRRFAPAHLARHSPERVAREYLAIIASAYRGDTSAHQKWLA